MFIVKFQPTYMQVLIRVMKSLENTLRKTVTSLQRIDMTIDIGRLHFSWLKGYNVSLPIRTTLYDVSVTVTPPKVIPWLGFFLDRRLSWDHHVNTWANRGINILNGLSCLGNTIHGLNQGGLSLLCHTCVIPVITYGCPLWFRPDGKKLIQRLDKVKNKVLVGIAGVFHTALSSALGLLTHISPIKATVGKLTESAALHFFHLPHLSQISLRLSPYYSEHRIAMPKANPFPNYNTEQNVHSHNASYACSLSSLPFAGRLLISHATWPKKDRSSRSSQFNDSFRSTFRDPSLLHVFTDGSKKKAPGCAVVGYYLGKIVFTVSIKLVRNASSHDAEMYALAHAVPRIRKFVTKRPHISEVRLHSDSATALQTIHRADARIAQSASTHFRTHSHALLTALPSLRIRASWVPGHKGVIGMEEADKRAKEASCNPQLKPLLDHAGYSAALSKAEKRLLQSWKKACDDVEVKENKPPSTSAPA